MTAYDWLELRSRAIELFNGDTPGAELEHRIVNHFTEHPGRVTTSIDSIGRKVAQGGIRSGWAILLRELDAKPPQARATDNAERAKAIIRADKWICNAGGYLPTEDEFVDALFGPHGALYLHRDDTQLVERMTRTWAEHRPRFEHTENESERWQAEQTALRKRLRKATSSAANDAIAKTTTELVARDVTRQRDKTEPPPLDDETADLIAELLAHEEELAQASRQTTSQPS